MTFSFKLLLFWVIVLSILYLTLSLVRHNNFQSGGFDLGIYDQAVWQYSQFIYPFNTIKEKFILGDHLTLTLPLLAPLFWAWNDVRVLLIFQAFWISFSTFAIYKLILLRGFSKLTSSVLSVLYSLFYGIQFIIFFDFHPVAIAVGLVPWMLYFLEAQKKKLFWISLFLFLLTQENMGIALASIGIIYIFKGKYRTWGFFLIVGGLITSFVMVKIVAFFSPTGYQYWPTIDQNPILLLSRFFDTEEKRLVWLYSFSWFSFLPLFHPGALLASLLDLSQYFLPQKQFGHMITPFLHHRAILGIFLFLGTLEVLYFLKKRKINIEVISIILLAVALFLQYYFHFPLNKLAKRAYWQKEQWMEDNYKLFKFISQDASLVTSQHLVPHLSHRKEIYLAWPRKHDFQTDSPCGQKSCWWLDFAGKPKYLVVNVSKNQWVTQLLESPQNFQEAVKDMEKTGKIKLEKEINSAKLYKVIY